MASPRWFALPKVAESKRLCCLCLYSTGLGVKQICRYLNVSPKVALRWLNEAGILDKTRRPIWEVMVREKNGGVTRKVVNDQKRATKPERDAARKAVAAVEQAKREAVEREAKAIRLKEKHDKRLANMPLLKLKIRLRTFVWKVITQPKSNGFCGTNDKCKRGFRMCRTCFCKWLTGCTPEQLRTHVANRLELGMTFENYGEWEIDHRVPCKAFDFRKERDIQRCFHPSNLRPLWQSENRRKSAKMGPFVLTG